MYFLYYIHGCLFILHFIYFYDGFYQYSLIKSSVTQSQAKLLVVIFPFNVLTSQNLLTRKIFILLRLPYLKHPLKNNFVRETLMVVLLGNFSVPFAIQSTHLSQYILSSLLTQVPIMPPITRNHASINYFAPHLVGCFRTQLLPNVIWQNPGLKEI